MIRLRIDGTPIPQGSMRYVGGNRIVHSNAAKLKPWRDAIRSHAEHAWRNRETITGACALHLEFILPRPASRHSAEHADRKPDLDKLVRGVGDALESVAYENDSRVIEIRATKRYCRRDEPAGVAIGIQESTE
jgi:Holliday junction resolvase RusA-like endonuclease